MSQVVIGDILPYTQATATASQTVFSTNWTANYASDVVVYQTPSGDPADDATQILAYPATYSVAFIGDQQQVQVTLVTGASMGDIITITRQTPADRENLYSNTNFTPTMLNNDFGILTLVDQQAQLVNQLIGPRYNYSAVITDVIDTILPILGENETWVKNAGNTAIIPYALPASGTAPSDGTYITFSNQSSTLPDSYQLLAGSNVTLTPGVNTLTVNVTSQSINPGVINNLAYYAASGSSLSPVATANNGVLVTSSGGAPSISSILPDGLSGGGIIFGSTTGPVANVDGTIQAVGVNTLGNYYAASYINSAGSAPTSWFYKSRSITVGSFVAVQGNDVLGRLEFFGDDGTQFTEGSHIVVQATGSVSSGIVPTIMTIATANTSGALIPAIVIDEDQKSTFSSLAFSPTTNGIVGTTTNDDASSGFVGEYVSSIIPNASAISLTNNTNISVTTISLTAGDWDIYGNVSLNGDASTLLQYYSCWVGVSSSTPDPSLWAGQSYGTTGLAVFAENEVGDTAPFARVSLATTTTVHLAVIAGFSVSTCTACGGLFARRVR